MSSINTLSSSQDNWFNTLYRHFKSVNSRTTSLKMTPNITIWHNSNCSTSRKTLEYLRTKNVNITIRNYQEKPPSLKELAVVLKKMKQKPEYILRKKEKLFQELFSEKELTEEEQLQILHDNPVLIERPIVIMGRKAFLARPFDEFVVWVNAQLQK